MLALVIPDQPFRHDSPSTRVSRPFVKFCSYRLDLGLYRTVSSRVSTRGPTCHRPRNHTTTRADRAESRPAAAYLYLESKGRPRETICSPSAMVPQILRYDISARSVFWGAEKRDVEGGGPETQIQARDPHPVNLSQEVRLLEDSLGKNQGQNFARTNPGDLIWSEKQEIFLNTQLTLGLQQQTAGAADSVFRPHGLDGLGPLYQATQHPHELMPAQGGFSYPPDAFPASSQPSFSTLSASAYPGLQPSATPAAPIAANWQPALYSYATNNSPAYSLQQTTPSPYAASFVSHSPALQHAPQSVFDGYQWPQPSDGNLTLGSNLASASLPSPALQNFETLSVAQGGAFSDSDPAMYGEAEAEDWEQQQQQQQISPGRAIELESPRNKRAKKSGHQRSSSSLSAPANKPASKTGTNTANSASNSKGKHRRASASKMPPFPTEESPQDRTRSRNSHNLVEKQYRNRLNMQFENLMNTLPESMRSPTGNGFGLGTNVSGGDSDGQGQGGSSGSPANLGAFEAGERRLSKAQVLDRSAQYIRSLESEKDKLTSEKEALLENIRQLSEKCQRVQGGEGQEAEEGERG